MEIKLLVVDDHPMMRESIIYKLDANIQKHTFLTEEAESAREAIEKVKNADFDFIIMDNQLPDGHGAEATAIILNHRPSAKVMAFSNSDDILTVKSFFNAGAKGIILKNAHANEFIRAIEDVLAGKTYFSSEITTRLLTTEESITQANKQLSLLTRREIEILRLIDHSSYEIGQKLCIAKRTVDGHKAKLFEKLQIKNTPGLVKYAIEAQLIALHTKKHPLKNLT